MANTNPAAKPKKKGFKMPNIMFLVLGILIFMSLMTYIIPAGQFATDPETNKLLGDQFAFLPEQTPVNPWEAIMMILPGLTSSGQVIGLLLCGGGFSGVVLATGAIDRMVDFAIYKFKDQGLNILIPIVFFIYCFVGGFQGGDQIIAMVPIGLAFAKKLRLDPVVGLSVILLAFHVGGLSSPTSYAMLPQLMMGVELYSGFGTRVVILIILSVVAMLMVLRYAKKVAKDPKNSILDPDEWYAELDVADTTEVKEAAITGRDIAVVVLFLLQPIAALVLVTGLGMGTPATAATMIIMAIVIGLVHGFNGDQIGGAFAKGTAGMAFVGFIIGVAASLSTVMNTGNIIHTIVHYACMPLNGLSTGVAAVGMNLVITFINLFIPSASAKAAVLVPIVQPMCEMLGVSLQVGVQSFMYGDKLTNIISPVLGTTVAALALAKIDYTKWVKWVLPKLAVLACICWASLVILTTIGWQ
ncbi:MAG: YfcC family protein [Angelakisella sp.]|jgi:uncharacterized ion transporter superfamily protein YfcC|nr:YfcC family protein [Angelakisella sp.]